MGWIAAAVACAIGIAAPEAMPAVPDGPVPAQPCPPGEHEDTQTTGFQCVPGWCPSGMLLDGVTHACVSAPGEPPEALPGG